MLKYITSKVNGIKVIEMSNKFVNVLYQVAEGNDKKIMWVFDDHPEEELLNVLTGVYDSFFQLRHRRHILNENGDKFIVGLLMKEV